MILNFKNLLKPMIFGICLLNLSCQNTSYYQTTLQQRRISSTVSPNLKKLNSPLQPGQKIILTQNLILKAKQTEIVLQNGKILDTNEVSQATGHHGSVSSENNHNFCVFKNVTLESPKVYSQDLLVARAGETLTIETFESSDDYHVQYKIEGLKSFDTLECVSLVKDPIDFNFILLQFKSRARF